MDMVDVEDKDIVKREAEARGRIFLKNKTLEKIAKGKIKKGDPFQAAKIASMQAVKNTPGLLAYCHNIPIDCVSTEFEMMDDQILATTVVRAEAKTGVEMEALCGLSLALLTLWDMVKYLEKNADGQYPETRISDIRVTRKQK